jgi:tRNA modification GTPase
MKTNGALNGDTIVAIATAAGRGGVGIIRLSGPEALTIGEAISRRALKPRYAHYVAFCDQRGNSLDAGIALFFPLPGSFTGEDVVELQAHGGPVILDIILRECASRGARMARPGEFSERAYLNGKIDLAQAEAIADLINSTTEQSALNASRSLQGVFSDKVHALVTAVTRLRVYVEAAIDFPEEEVDFISEGQVANRLRALIEQSGAVLGEARQGRLIQEGMKLVIAGRPNAGKSSLLNALSGRDTAIVTAVEGTTRDVLREHIELDGMPLHIADTAGLRESTDEVELEGIRRARREIESADRVLLVVDGSINPFASSDLNSDLRERIPDIPDNIPLTIVLNKCDLALREPEVFQYEHHPVVRLSARSGEGVNLLRDHLKACMGFEPGGDSQFSARRRHLLALQDATDTLQSGLSQLLSTGAGELLAEDLRLCQNKLGEITGAISSDQLLGEIFSSFCIGK